ncbi:MAG: GMC family oxidoreductase N-terminal domain-containing protein [Pirellulaceae bacterium]|nr:GMC family oxidoreductase N-terminal domain-containing protein [Pirellulaceae bacterium]
MSPAEPAKTNASPKATHAKDKVTRRAAIQMSAVAIAAATSGTVRADRTQSTLGEMLSRRKSGDSEYKATAIGDYHANVAEFGGQVAAPSRRLLVPLARHVPWQFDILIIGSGYGASVSAARLASALRPGARLGVLERGREWIPGTFPDRLKDVTSASRLELLGPKKGEIRDPTGLFDVRQFEEITILAGSGLGGSSLINASVAYRPDREVFQQPMWPQLLRDRVYLDPYFELAIAELGANVEPLDYSSKMLAQRVAAERLAYRGARFDPAAITVARSMQGNALPIINRQSIRQRNCIDCGDCLSGCNVGAKNTLAMNYIPMARRAGAEFFTQTEVHRIEKLDVGYRVHFTVSWRKDDGTFERCPGSTTTRVLILGAGSLGSTELLLRSQSECLQLSQRLGFGWTGNGDALGFITKSECPTSGAGRSAYEAACPPVGPTIQSNLTYPQRPLPGRVLIQEGAAARAYANAIGTLMLDPTMENTQILLGMGHDGANGRITLNERGFGQVSWPELLNSEYRKLIRFEFEQIATALGGKYRYLRIFGDKMISVHPLGGCGMSDDPLYGVVNHKGQVFDGRGRGDLDYQTGAPRVHSGLYVVDGAILPTSIACNPFLTISALAERASDLMLDEPEFADLFATT